MLYQLPVLSDDTQFERLIRDILRRDYNDKGVERFGRSGQAQFGIDGVIPSAPEIVFQCKLKDVRFKDDGKLRDILLSEMEDELNKTEGLTNKPERFIFAATFKNDTQLQEKGLSLSNKSLTVEYWGWDTISEKVWQYALDLIPIYYPQFPVRQVSGFRAITPELIAEFQNIKSEDLNKLAIDYYRINDRGDVVLRVVCNSIDVRNEKLMYYIYRRLESLPPNGTLWILGNGGSGKTTVLHRLAFELTGLDRIVYMLDLENHLSGADLESVLSCLKFVSASQPTVLCIDNPAADEEILEQLLRRIPDYCPEIHILLAERDHRYRTLKRTGTLIYLHGEEENKPVNVHNSPEQRHKVYHKLFDLLGISEADRTPLLKIALDENLVYVNATYSILLELRRQGKIDFKFDWDDYLKLTEDLPAFKECYKYIALFYLFAVKTPFTVLSKIFAADETQQRLFIERFRGLVNEPVILDERRDESYRINTYVRTKHEIVSEIYFSEHPEINKDKLLMELCENTDFTNALETQALINIFGAKKNYAGESAYIDFNYLIDFLLQGYIHKKVILSPKFNETLHLAKTWFLLLQNKIEDAVSVLELFLKNSPERLHARTELAKIYQRQNKLKEAEGLLLKILEIKPDDLNSRTELAKIYQRQGKLIEAETLLKETLKIKSNDLNSRTEMAKIYQRQGKIIEAENILLKLLEIDENNIRAYTELSKIYQRQNKLDKAEGLLLKILEIKPDDLNSRTELAKIYQRQNKLKEAEGLLLKILEIKPDDLNSRTELAKIYQRQGNLKEAEAVLLESLEIDSEQLHPRTELAKIYQRQGKLKEAEALLLESLEIDSEQLHPRTELAKIYQRQGKLKEAEALLLELLEFDTKNLQARTELAKIYQRQNKLDKAEAVLLELLELNANNLQARTELAKIYQRQAKFTEAENLLLESLDIDDRQLHPRTELAKIYQKLEKLDEAEKRLQEILEINPLNDFAVSELLAIWKQQKEKEKCVQRFFQFIDQPEYRFSRYSQAPVFRFFQCCRAFNMDEYAGQVFERFKSELDEKNINYYKNNFNKKV